MSDLILDVRGLHKSFRLSANSRKLKRPSRR